MSSIHAVISVMFISSQNGTGVYVTSGVCSCLCRQEEHQIGRVFLPGPAVMRDKANRRNVNTHYKPATPRKNGVIC